jgi:hypothetical protein
MKKQFLTILAIIVTGAAIAQTTPEKKESNLELIINGKIGFARMRGSDFIPLNGNVNGSDIMLAYKFDPRWSISGGVGWLQFSANTTLNGSSASVMNNYLQIPVRINGDYNIFNGTEPKDPKVFFNLSAGPYANNLLKQEVQTMAGITSTKNVGWNFGLATSVGLKVVVTNALNLGLGLESQSEFTKMKKDGAEQRIDQMNTMYFRMGLTF